MFRLACSTQAHLGTSVHAFNAFWFKIQNKKAKYPLSKRFIFLFYTNITTKTVHYMQISFRANIPETIPEKYYSPQSKADTIAILGSSKQTDEILKYMDMCSNITKAIILSGKNIVHGCGNSGIMGSAYKAGQEYSKKDEQNKPLQNLAIIANPLWGDEDLENCIPLTTTDSEAERIEKFADVANTIVVFPGSVSTIQEVSTLIAKNYYGKPENRKQIILVGKDFFKGLITQYEKLYNSGLINCPPDVLFKIADNEADLLNLIDERK